MEAKEILARTKQFFNDLVNAPAPTEAAPAALVATEYELKDGGKVVTESP